MRRGVEEVIGARQRLDTSVFVLVEVHNIALYNQRLCDSARRLRVFAVMIRRPFTANISYGQATVLYP